MGQKMMSLQSTVWSTYATKRVHSKRLNRKRKTIQNLVNSKYRKKADIKESLTDITNQYDSLSLHDRDEIIDCQDTVTDQSDDQTDYDEIIGDHETQLIETNEANLHKYLNGCTKNPGHREFIPVGTFSLKHLPKGRRDIDLYELIKATADLTVRVDVRMTSPDRPKVWPETNVPYPFYNIRKSTHLRTGSGRIDRVFKFKDGLDVYGYKQLDNSRNCWCKDCEGTGLPSDEWWEFYVITAAHVVFDDIEASHTTLRLFYDSDDSPVVSVNKVNVDFVLIGHDRCRINCVTCDGNLGKKLEKMWEHYWDVSRKVFIKNPRSKDLFELTFIVSHPHGCSKQVSIGQWKDKYCLGDEEHKFTYTTCTCPGSSGANVHSVGYNALGSWCSDLVHSGSLRSGLNQSGVGWVYRY